MMLHVCKVIESPQADHRRCSCRGRVWMWFRLLHPSHILCASFRKWWSTVIACSTNKFHSKAYDLLLTPKRDGQGDSKVLVRRATLNAPLQYICRPSVLLVGNVTIDLVDKKPALVSHASLHTTTMRFISHLLNGRTFNTAKASFAYDCQRCTEVLLLIL